MRRHVLIPVALLLSSLHGAAASELKVLSGSAVQPVMNEITSKFGRDSGHRITFDYGTLGSMAARVQKGERADVIIASGPQIAALEKQGKVVSAADLIWPKQV